MAIPDTRPVVVAYDGSAEAQAAVREAAALFGQRPLVIVAVWEPGLAAMPIGPGPGEGAMSYLPPDPAEMAAVDDAERGHAATIAEQGAHLARGLGATAEALSVPDEAAVAETVAGIADERDARAIVVGSRGLGGIKARLLGSTSQGLLHHTHRPVLVVRAPE
jgi:nucleotide-binding universal stress UspA family protein